MFREGEESVLFHNSRSKATEFLGQSHVTRGKSEPRSLTLRPQAEHAAIQAMRQQQVPEEWKSRYNVRAGIEGTLSQGIRVFGLRRTRYIGLAKTNLQHLLTAAAMNVVRLLNWLDGLRHAKTRISRFAVLNPAAQA